MQEIQLTRGYVALVDDADSSLVSQMSWYAKFSRGKIYAARSVTVPGATRKRRTEFMHVLLMGVKGIDHIDGDGLNNQRDNLRLADQRHNSANRKKSKSPASSVFKGVTFLKDRGQWMASIRPDGKFVNLGRFANETEAALAYNRAAKEAFGEFASLNRIDADSLEAKAA